MIFMTAASTTPHAVEASAQATLRCPRGARRRTSVEAGRALEILGHAIEYLTDEYIYAGGPFSAHDGQVQAIQLLMATNRRIYFECPVVPSVAQRFLAFFHLRTA